MDPQSHMVCGVSFQKSPVHLRERVAISSEKLPDALSFLSGQPGIKECMVLSTCNRTELYLSADAWVDGEDLFIRFARTLRDFDLSPFAYQIYVLRGHEAILHLFRVASSLDSLVPGEPQILGQTKAAFREAENRGCVGRNLHRWMPRAFAVAKQVRSETGIGDSAVSVSYAAVQLAGKIFEDLSEKAAVLVGAGKMGELAAIHLHEAGVSSIAVTNRTLSRAKEVAARCSGTAVEFELLEKTVSDADIVICSTDAPRFVLTRQGTRRILTSRCRRPLLVLDISMPRNVDPEVSSLDGVYLFNIDDLESVVQANKASRQSEAVRAELILKLAVDRYLREEEQARKGPAIAAVRGRVLSICQAELQRLQRRLPDLPEEHRDELEVMLHRIAQKILHPAIMELKAMEEDPGADAAKPTLVERLFGVEQRASFSEF
jgi:glutamyl-tRNA reductase